MAVGDEVILRVIGRVQSQNVVNTLHYEITAQASAEEDILQILCVRWLADIKVGWLARHCDDYTLVGVKAFSKTGATKVPGQVASGDAGSIVADSLPASICRTITLYGDSANSKRRGRVMLSSTEPAHIDDADGGVVAAEVSLMNVLGALLLETISDGGDDFDLRLGSSLTNPMISILAHRARRTLASITSRRIREFLVG